MTVAEPSDSMMLVRLMSTWRSAMRDAVMDRHDATVAGSPSGTLATMTMMKPLTNEKMKGRPRPMPMPKSAPAVMTAITAMTSTNRCTSFSSSVSSMTPDPAARVAMEPIMEWSPVLMTTP